MLLVLEWKACAQVHGMRQEQDLCFSAMSMRQQHDDIMSGGAVSASIAANVVYNMQPQYQVRLLQI